MKKLSRLSYVRTYGNILSVGHTNKMEASLRTATMGFLDRLNPRKNQRPRSSDDASYDEDLMQSRSGSPDEDPRRRGAPTPRRNRSTNRRPPRQDTITPQEDEPNSQEFEKPTRPGMQRRRSMERRNSLERTPRSIQRSSSDRKNYPKRSRSTEKYPASDNRSGQARGAVDDKATARTPIRRNVSATKLGSHSFHDSEKPSRPVMARKSLSMPSRDNSSRPGLMRRNSNQKLLDADKIPPRPAMQRRRSGDVTENTLLRRGLPRQTHSENYGSDSHRREGKLQDNERQSRRTRYRSVERRRARSTDRTPVMPVRDERPYEPRRARSKSPMVTTPRRRPPRNVDDRYRFDSSRGRDNSSNSPYSPEDRYRSDTQPEETYHAEDNWTNNNVQSPQGDERVPPLTTELSSHEKNILQNQKSREEAAEKQGLFIENQRVRYYHKGANTWYEDVMVVAVHLDDGPDKPYYTVKYTKGDGELMEKQTTAARLQCVEWDERKTFEILKLGQSGRSVYEQRILDNQKTREHAAERQGLFIEKQRVRYYNKSTNTWYEDVQVMAVHHDDGPDRPYYTIKYENDDGETVEKQTNPDRLEYVEWDEEKAWAILKC